MAASRDKLGLLHDMLSEAFIRRLKMHKMEDGSEMDFASSADLNAIANFLKQNDITADAEKSTQLSELDKLFAARKSKPTPDEVADAYVEMNKQDYH